MKKTIGLVIAAAVVLMCGRPCAAQSAVASIVKTQGKVETAAAGTEQWKYAKPGTALADGMKIRTGRGAEALVQWKQGHVLKVFAMSTVTIERAGFSGKKEETKLDVENGKIFVKAKKLTTADSKFEVKTPTAIAGVRGTEFMVEVSQTSSAATITLIQGQLNIVGEQIQTILEENTAITVAPEMTTAPEPVAIDRDTISDMKDISSGIDAEIKDIETVPGAGYQPDPADVVDNTINDIINDVIINRPEDVTPPPPNLPPLPPEE